MALHGGGPAGNRDGDSVTVFSIPAPFDGHTGVIQRNAIGSWTRLPRAKVILFGDEPGVGEAAAELGARHEPTVARNELGTPLVSDAFERAADLADTPLLLYANGDVLFTPALSGVVGFLQQRLEGAWLAVGRRLDLDVNGPWTFDSEWAERLVGEARSRGVLHGPSGIDYFLFPRGLELPFPELAVGRPGWDNWLIGAMHARGLPVFDLTPSLLCIHQNHPPRYSYVGTEAKRNVRAAGGVGKLHTIRSATWKLEPSPNGFRIRRNLMGALVSREPLRTLINLKRHAMNLLLALGDHD
jgi:hypothetical protein